MSFVVKRRDIVNYFDGSKASCLSFRCFALVCGASRRVTFRFNFFF